MYSTVKHIQILIALLKKYNIRHFVLSPGACNIPFIHSIEKDPFFTCYSVVDERSAAYFAVGLSQELNEPVGVSCTQSTAACNYLPAVTEAFYRNVQLLVLTSDVNPIMFGQMENQSTIKHGMFRAMCKKHVTLPYVENNDDFYHVERLINEALLELNHHTKGPVHINISTMVTSDYTVKELPNVKKIERINIDDDNAVAIKLAELRAAKRILLIFGQNYSFTTVEKKYIENFFETFNCAIYVENISNLDCKGSLHGFIVCETVSSAYFNDNLKPDLVISFCGNITSQLKNLLRYDYPHIKHWRVCEDGELIDMFKSLSTIFECSIDKFFKYFAAKTNTKNDLVYYNSWSQEIRRTQFPDFEFSNVSIIKYFIEKMPGDSLLHLGILNCVRIAEYFDLPRNTRVHANIGTYGIDGSMSTFLGQAQASDSLAFLIIGDLSFFYDMNSVGIRHIKNNTRILLINNGGGAEFHYNTGKNIDPTIDLHTAARHHTTAKGWIESCGIKYLSAHNAKEYFDALNIFVSSDEELPIVFEVFTEMEDDAATIHSFYNLNRKRNATDVLHNNAKNIAKKILGNDGFQKIKSIIKKS
jgi:2-succinyl-5-enolpyruvyl-6-hydroxy-3-cyclohexene-1-carboxylate synthase